MVKNYIHSYIVCHLYIKVCRELKNEKNGDHRKVPQTKALFKLSLSNAPCVYLYLPSSSNTKHDVDDYHNVDESQKIA